MAKDNVLQISSSNEGFAFCTKTACCEYHVRSKKRPAVLGPGPGPADNNYCRRWTRALEDILIDLNHQTFISLDMIDNVSEVCLKECKCFRSFDNFSLQILALSYTQFQQFGQNLAATFMSRIHKTRAVSVWHFMEISSGSLGGNNQSFIIQEK